MKKKLLLLLFTLLMLVACSSNKQAQTEDKVLDITDESETLEDNANTEVSEDKVLVAYFSGTGNTEKVAEYIANHLNADLFEIIPEVPYTNEDLSYTNEESRVMKEHNDESLQDIPLSVTTPDNFENYSTVYIGYPIWWGDAAWPTFHFVSDNDFTNKTVICFTTSASSPLGDSVETLKALSNGGNWLEGQRFSSSVSEEEVIEWVDSLN